MRDASILLRLVHEAMQAMQVDVAQIYQKCGITLEHIQDRKARLNIAVISVFGRWLSP